MTKTMTTTRPTTRRKNRGRAKPLLAVLTVTILTLGVGGSASAQEPGLVHEFSVEPGVDGQPDFSSPHHVAASPDGRHVYVTTFPSPLGVSLLTFERTADDLELLETRFSGDDGVEFFPQGLVITTDGAFVLLASFSPAVVHVFARDGETGLLTHVQTITDPDLTTVDGVAADEGLAVMWGATVGGGGRLIELKRTDEASALTVPRDSGAPFVPSDLFDFEERLKATSALGGSWAARSADLLKFRAGDIVCTVTVEKILELTGNDGPIVNHFTFASPSSSLPPILFVQFADGAWARFSSELDCQSELESTSHPFQRNFFEEIGPGSDTSARLGGSADGLFLLDWLFTYTRKSGGEEHHGVGVVSTETSSDGLPEFIADFADIVNAAEGRALDVAGSEIFEGLAEKRSRSSHLDEYRLVYATVPDPASIHAFRFTPAETGPPEPPEGAWLEDPDLSGFRSKVRISAGDTVITGQRVEPCIGETLCVSGALPDRAEVFVRVVGPKPNDKLWPTLVKFSTSRVEVWIEQTATGEVQYYDLASVAPGQQILTLDGLADKEGFDPAAAAEALFERFSGLARGGAPAVLATRDEPDPPMGAWLEDPDLPGFRAKVRISAGDTVITGLRVEPCIGETLCVAGALPDRAELFVRVVGPKPNGKLWPTLAKFSTSRAEVWIEQTATGEIQYYDLAPVSPGQRFLTLEGLADKEGFDP